MRFDTDIFMDRYFSENRQVTTQIRMKVAQWRSELAALNKQINSITHFKVAISARQMSISESHHVDNFHFPLGQIAWIA